MEFVKNLKEIGKNDVAIAGGKGSSLGEMIKSKIPVPEGFIVLSKAFQDFIKQTDLDVDIDAILDKVDTKKVHTVEEASEKIQSLILNKEIPDKISKAIVRSFDDLGVKYVAVRSSATSEDNVATAWAGQLDTFLNTTKKTLLENVKKCWASLFTPRAIVYRIEKKLRQTKVSVAVVIQKMIDSEESGIAFSVHPITEDPSQLIIEAGFGLGEAIVSGEITPDSYVVNKQDLEIIDINVNKQGKGLFRKIYGGNEWRDLGENGENQVLNRNEIVELSKLIVKIERFQCHPCDIEWAKEKGKFYILQSRPITTLTGKKKTISKEDKNLFGYWDEYNPRVVTPLEYDLYMKDIWQASLDMLDFGDGVPKIEEVVVFNQKVPIKIDPSKYEKKSSAPKKNINLFEEVGKWRRKIKNIRKALGDLSKLTEKEILDKLEIISEEYRKMARNRLLNMNTWIDKESEVKDLFKNSDMEFNEQKLIAGLDTETAKMNQELLNLALLKKADTDKFEEKFNRFLEEYGHFESEGVSLEENKKTLLNYINNLSKTKIENRLNISKKDYENYKSNLLKKLDSNKQKAMEKGIKELREAIKLREDSKSLQDAPKPIIDNLLVELGNRLKKKSFIDHSSDVYLLRLEELKEKKIDKDFLVKRKKILDNKRKESWLPNWFIGKKKLDSKEILEGISGSKGSVTGRVKVIKNPKEFDKVKKGDIIVAYSTNPLWTQLFSIISGIIVEHGTILSHAAITAREYGIPCVVGVRDVTNILKNGDEVEVDGDEGIIKLYSS